jgi:hypothetical protein
MPNKPGSLGLAPMTEDFSFEPPETTLDDSDEKRKKNLSKSKQWKEAKAYLEQRRELYRAQLPGGAKFRNMPKEDAAHYAAVADCVIEEIDIWINTIEGAM